MNKGEKTKQLIIEKSRKLFAQKGFNATTTSEIAQSAGISEATIYKYFSNKKDLLLACVTPHQEEAGLEAELAGMKTEELAEEYVLDKIRWVEQNREQIEILISESLHHPELSEMYMEQIDRKNALETEMERRITLGEMEKIPDFFLFRLGLTSSILNIMNHKRIQSKQETFDFSPEMKKRVVQLVLYGLIGKRE